MNNPNGSLPEHIIFNRPKKYNFVKHLDPGACGATVCLRDAEMDCYVVAKKFQPFFEKSEDPKFYVELLDRFKEEAKILFRANHKNIIRIFNFIDYAEHDTAFIIMEHVDGQELPNYLAQHPYDASNIFEQIVDGFAYLEQNGILHRDIRPANILVHSDGTAKIIDFGFGKVVEAEGDGSSLKSVTLNWWCATPRDFDEGTYDRQTEVYFVGKIFEHILRQAELKEFSHSEVLRRMIVPERVGRIKSFNEIQRTIKGDTQAKISFSEKEKSAYRQFAEELSDGIGAIGHDAAFRHDITGIMHDLETALRKSILEEYVQDFPDVANAFIKGSYTYKIKKVIQTSTLSSLIDFLSAVSAEKRAVAVENISKRLDAIPKKPRDIDEEIPF